MASNDGFLTEEQRELLKIASLGRDSAHSQKIPNSPRSGQELHAKRDSAHSQKIPNSPRSGQELHAKPGAVVAKNQCAGAVGKQHDKRSYSTKNGRPKKSGCGGKGTWGGLLDTDGDLHIDRNDPNYDSEEEPYQLVGTTVSQSLEEYKRKVGSIIEEYFATDDVAVAAADLADVGCPSYHHYFVKKLISMAMDRHDREKEMAAVLLSSLYADVIEPEQVSKGFSKLLDSADDLALDIPDAVDILALFVARAIVDDILPPAFLTKTLKSLPKDSKGVEVIQKADKSYLSAPLHAEIIERRWGGSTHITVEEVKKKISDLLNEYVESGDKVEACRCIRDLNVPFFHHEVAKRALILAMERRSAEPLILALLKEAAEEGLITSSQMSKGFGRLADTVDDLSLDIINAKDMFESLVLMATTEGWLSSASVKSIPSRLNGPAEHDNARVFKERAVTIIQEYFLSDDIFEVVRSLEDLAAPDFNAVFVKRLITLAMDRKNREKEMASVLLSALYTEVFPVEDIVNGFVLLLESAEDTALDIPDAANELALFGTCSSSSSSAIFLMLRPPTKLSFLNSFHVTPLSAAKRLPGSSSSSLPRLRAHSRKFLPNQQPKRPSKLKLHSTNENENEEISRAKEILGVVNIDAEYNKERHDEESKSKQQEEHQLQKKNNAFEEWLDNKLASGDLSGNSSGKEKWVQLDKAKRKFYEKRKRRMYGTDSEDEAAAAKDDEKYIELKPEIVEFKSFYTKQEELYFYDAFCFPWEKDRHYRMIRKLEQKYYPDQGLEQAFIDPDEPLKPHAHKPTKTLNKIVKNVHSEENDDSDRNEAEPTPSTKISEEDGDAFLSKTVSSQTGKSPAAAVAIDINSDDSDMKGLSEKKKEEVQKFVKSLKGARIPNLNGATAAAAIPYLLTTMSELPARWDGPLGTMLLIDKPKGWTSFTVCGKLRRLIKVEKVGHAGTLDPMATGLLIVCVGKATKQLQSFQDMIKVYSGVFRLGEATSTWDADSPVIERQPWEHVKDDDIQKAVTSFYGEIWQVPPMFSAIKVGGEKMYDKARRGETIDLPPRRVLIYEFDVQRSLDDRQNLIFKVTCSKGTYVRSLCADFGRTLGSCAHLTSLRRDQIGDYSVADAWKFSELENEIAKHYI